jgi:hypothetical protein
MNSDFLEDFRLLKPYYGGTEFRNILKRALRPPTSLLFLALLIGMTLLGAGSISRVHATSLFSFSTGSADGKMGMASRVPSGSVIEIETADDFITTSATTVDHATFVGLLPSGDPLSDITQVTIEVYRVFPADSANPPSGNVPTRTNSPSDNVFDSRSNAVLGDLTFTDTTLLSSFSVTNTVVNGINKIPSQFTGGEGAATGEEVSFDVTLTKPFTLPSDHYFFVPQVELFSGGTFLWLSAPNPIVGGTGPFTPDLQTWIRNINLAPDWLRVGTDITHQGPFNGVFSLSGTSTSATGVPEFPLPAILVGAVALASIAILRKLKITAEFR